MRRHLAHYLALALLLASVGAAQGPNNSEATPARTDNTAHSKPENRKAMAKVRPYQIGTASWYGSYFDGKTTASGEAYDMYDLTAAHPTLPLGSYVRVTNLHNGREIVVRVNDRGPIVQGRIIDLSYRAAEALQFQGKGIQKVRLDVVKAGNRPHVALIQVAYNHPVAQLH